MLFVVGYHASGKTHLAQMLVQDYGLLHIETSGVVRDFKALTNTQEPMEIWASRIEEEYGKNFFDELIVQKVRNRYQEELNEGITPQDIVITGNRSLSGILYAAEHLENLINRPASIIAIDVNPEERYTRYRERDRRPGDASISAEDFMQLNMLERDTGLDEIFMHADYTIANSGSREEFLSFSREIIEAHLGLQGRSIEGNRTYREFKNYRKSH